MSFLHYSMNSEEFKAWMYKQQVSSELTDEQLADMYLFYKDLEKARELLAQSGLTLEELQERTAKERERLAKEWMRKTDGQNS